ncbi:MAG: TetR/AcrR family transcriptional regulator [Polyangiales bacterium]
MAVDRKLKAKKGARGAKGEAVTSRVPPDERRAQLVHVASELLTAHGLEMVQIKEVAERAGVSRPLVYRLFPTRKALVRAVLDEFATDLARRFHRALIEGWPGTLERATGAFISACCDAIEANGAGPWLLLDAHAVEPELARLGRATLDSLLEPWERKLAELGGLAPRRARAVLRIVVAAGRAALDGWLEGTSSRAQATQDAVRTVTALLQALAVERGEAASESAPTKSTARKSAARR